MVKNKEQALIKLLKDCQSFRDLSDEDKITIMSLGLNEQNIQDYLSYLNGLGDAPDELTTKYELKKQKDISFEKYNRRRTD